MIRFLLNMIGIVNNKNHEVITTPENHEKAARESIRKSESKLEQPRTTEKNRRIEQHKSVRSTGSNTSNSYTASYDSDYSSGSSSSSSSD